MATDGLAVYTPTPPVASFWQVVAIKRSMEKGKRNLCTRLFRHLVARGSPRRCPIMSVLFLLESERFPSCEITNACNSIPVKSTSTVADSLRTTKFPKLLISPWLLLDEHQNQDAIRCPLFALQQILPERPRNHDTCSSACAHGKTCQCAELFLLLRHLARLLLLE